MAMRKVVTRVQRTVSIFAAALIGLVAALVFSSVPAVASTTPDDPPEYLNATETGGTQQELDYWADTIPCPELSGVTLNPSGAYADGTSVQIGCWYVDEDRRSVGGYHLTWSKLGAETEFMCGMVDADLGWERQIAQPDIDARVQVQFAGAPAAMADEIAAGGEALYEFLRPRGNTCAPYDGPECPVIDGWVRRTFFGPSARMEITESEETAYSCAYRLPNPTFEGSIEQNFSINVLREGDFVTADDVLIACSAGSWFAFGQGAVGTEGKYSATADYTIRSADPIDTAPLLTAIDGVLEEFGPTGSGCEGLTLLPNDPYSPMPAYLADAFAAEKITAGRPPIIGAASPIAPPESDDAAATAEPATPVDDEPTTGTGADSPSDSTPVAASGPDEAPEVGAASGGSAWLWRTIAVLGLVLSVLSLAVTFLLIQRETRVRPKFDVFRIICTLIVAAAMMLIFSKGAPLWAVGLALVLGAGLGYWQGSNLVVRLSSRGVFAKRNAWAIGAFAAGIVISQVAGLLNRTGVVALGIALTFFSAALAVGLLVGRAPKLNAARAVAISTLAVFIVATLMAAVPSPRSASATTEPDEPRLPDGVGLGVETVAPEDRTPTMEALVDMVPWDTIQMNGGLWDDTGKPFVDIAVPRGLDAAPEPVTRTVAWVDAYNETNSYELTETFTFGMRSDGFCCSVDYEAAGNRTSGGNTEPVELIGKMADIQVFGVEGPGYSGGTFSATVTGLPFTEIENVPTYKVSDGLVDTTCIRPIAETRGFDAQTATGGEAVIESSTPNVAGFDYDLDLRLGAPCDLPDFTIENALAVAPEVPPIDDPARQLYDTGGCPVRQELLGALSDGTEFEGVHTNTVGELFLDPNGQVCDYGTLFDPPAIGQGGPGNTRQEFSIEFAKPRQGEWQRGYTSWFPDPCCVSLPSKMVPPSADTCTTDERDVPVAPADFEQGGTCSLVTQHRIEDVEGAQIWISTEYVQDGPNTTVRVELPWGAFRSRCHHCEPGDPRIVDFIDRMVEFGNDAAGNIGVAGETIDVGEIGETPGSRQQAQQGATGTDTDTDTDTDTGTGTGTDAGTDADAAARQEAEDLVDLVLDDDATDAEREAAIAAVIALLGAAAVGASTLGEAGVGAGEVWEAWRSGGRDGVDDLIRDRNTPDPMEGAVIDERGEVLLPGDDDLYEWDDGDTVRRVPRDELDELIAGARQAGLDQALDEARRVAEHDRLSDQDWADLRATTRLQTAEEMTRITAERLERERLVARGIALRDALDHVEDSNLRDRMHDFLERNPAPTDEDFWDLRDIMRQQEADQQAIDALGDDSVIEIALEGIQEDLARLAEASGQPAVAWVIRNPEIPIRLGVAYATGGLSEVALAPIDLWRALDARADAVLATENRDLTTAEIVEEITWAVAIEWIGSRVLGGGGRPDVPTTKPPMQLLPENYITRVAPGQRIPLVHQTGYTAEHITRLTTFAERNGVIPGARTANQYSAAQLRRGALPKPLDIKPKTINELDLYLGAQADHLGTVGFFQPRMPNTSGMGDDLADAVTSRFNARLAEQTKYLDEINANPNLRIERGRVVEASTGRPYAGDMDLVYLRDAKTGEVITGARYEQLRNQMVEEGLIEHGAEFNIHYDLTEGLTPGTAEYADALRRADAIATGTLMPTHMDGAPIMEIRNGVPVRGEDISYLPINPGHPGG
jgi:hypothetical protein